MRPKIAVLALSLGLAVLVPLAAVADTPDAWINAKTKIALITADDVSGTSINVDTRDGKVTLHGKVRTQAEKARAEEIAGRIDGVKEVKNLLQVVPSAKRETVKATDSVIKKRAEKSLDADPRLKDVDVASVNNGVVLLRGEVESVTHTLGAVEAVNKIPGVRRVAHEIRAGDDRPSTVGKVLDKAADTTERVTDRVHGTGERVLDTAADKTDRAAEKAVDKTEKVADKVHGRDEQILDKAADKTGAGKVADRATRTSDKLTDKAHDKTGGDAMDRPDTLVTLRTKLALLTADDVSGTSINVDTVDGKVTLQGKVTTQAERDKAEQVTRRISGVKEVKNLLQVVPAARREEVKASDAEIKSRVEDALQADKSLAGISIASVNNRVVVLKGEARTLAQTLRAVETASKVSGVRRVSSEIQVERE